MAKILIVDDEPRIRDLIRAHLEHEGFSCEEAGDGGAALAALSGGDVDLVILDIMMPFVDGMTCLNDALCGRHDLPQRDAQPQNQHSRHHAHRPGRGIRQAGRP